ncbi:hypothetical protein [Mesorhizobium sp. M0618]|uniref:hypothetical protein n=1 Tax=unclassified Mesorhizobium TaxID=325217 RepID=UPI0033382900
MKADIVSFPKAPGRCGSDVHERGRLASKRDQQKWFPVLRLIARQTKVQRSAKAVFCFGARADGVCESLLRRLGWRIEAPRRGRA